MRKDLIAFTYKKLFPNAIVDVDYRIMDGKVVVWNDAKLGPQPTDDQIAQAENEVIAEQWISQRVSAYVEEADPLAFEALFDHFARQDDTKLNAWVAKINEIKTRYPKS